MWEAAALGGRELHHPRPQSRGEGWAHPLPAAASGRWPGARGVLPLALEGLGEGLGARGACGDPVREAPARPPPMARRGGGSPAGPTLVPACATLGLHKWWGWE